MGAGLEGETGGGPAKAAFMQGAQLFMLALNKEFAGMAQGYCYACGANVLSTQNVFACMAVVSLCTVWVGLCFFNEEVVHGAFDGFQLP